MRAYVAVMHKEEDSEYGLSFPDFPGCVGAGATAQEAVDDALEALTGHIELLVEEGQAVPEPSSVDDVMGSGEAVGGTIVMVPAPQVSGKTVRVNITMPDDDLADFDKYCKINYLTRSGFILSACRQMIAVGYIHDLEPEGQPVESDNKVVTLRQASNAPKGRSRS